MILVLTLSVLVGLTLGLLGGGGSILMVPLLTYVAGMDAKESITTSLFVVGVTSLAGLLPHAQARNVQWVPGLVFAAASVGGAYLGGLVSAALPGAVLMTAFAVIMLASAANMIRGPKRAAETTTRRPKLLYIPAGLAVGLATGLVGAGGGFLIVPALVLLAGLHMKHAVGTSLLVIGLNSAAGLLGHLNSTAVHWPPTLFITAAAVIGSLIGARLTAKVPARKLRRGFGIFVLVMGVFVLAQELPHPAGLVLVAAASLAALVSVLCTRIPALAASCPWLRRPATPASSAK